MYLYSKDKSKNKLTIYSLDTTIEKISKFKKEQMSTIPETFRVLVATTNRYYKKCLNSNDEDIDYRQLELRVQEIPELFLYHTLEPSNQSEEEKQMTLEKYYKIIEPNGKLKRVTSNSVSEINYLVLMNEDYQYSKNCHKMNEIINIPRLLFVYERFIRGNLSSLTDNELNKILDLYTLSEPLDTIDLNEVNKMALYKVTESSETQLLSQLSRTEKILSLIKK